MPGTQQTMKVLLIVVEGFCDNAKLRPCGTSTRREHPLVRPCTTLRCLIALLFLLAAPAVHAAADNTRTSTAVSARALVERAIDLTRSRGSIAEMNMSVHRPEWQRSSSLKAWTRGREDALIRFTAPAKDAGNATLKLGRDMWTFAPRVNRVIRLPASLMSQSWAGSDFSYNDLARSDELLTNYDLRVSAQERVQGAAVYVIEAVPRAAAPVVWGRQQLRIRADGVVLETTYFDQDQQPVKRLQALRIGSLGGRVVPLQLRMTDLTEREHYTEIGYASMRFDEQLADAQFTQFALRNPQ